jgi:hypothetical protein
LLHAFVLLFQYYDSDFHFVPYMYRQNMAMGVSVITALIFIVMGVLNIVAMAMGMSRAGELTANARAANVASSGLVCGPMGSPEWKAMDGGNKGKQIVSSAGLLCLGIYLLVPALYFSWLYVGGVTFMYYTSGDTANMWHENATMATGHTFMFNGNDGLNSVIKCKTCTGTETKNCCPSDTQCADWSDPSTCVTTVDTKFEYPDCVGKYGVNRIKFDTGIKRKGTVGFQTVCKAGTETCDNSGNCGCTAANQVLAQEKYIDSEKQECNGPTDKSGEEYFMRFGLETPDTWHVSHILRVHAKLGGAFIWATVITGFFSVIRGASYAARSVSGLSLGMGVLGIFWIIQALCWFVFPDSHYVPQYWRDNANVAFAEGLFDGLIVAGLNLAGFAVGIAKVKEVENAGPAAPAAPMDGVMPNAEAEAPKEETA